MTWTWDYITIVYVTILLIFIIIGYFKGFSKGIIGLIGTAVSLIAAFLLAKPLGNLTYGKWGGGLTISFLLYPSPTPRDLTRSLLLSSALKKKDFT